MEDNDLPKGATNSNNKSLNKTLKRSKTISRFSRHLCFASKSNKKRQSFQNEEIINLLIELNNLVTIHTKKEDFPNHVQATYKEMSDDLMFSILSLACENASAIDDALQKRRQNRRTTA